MSIKTVKFDGSGSILEGSEISYSYSEDVSSLSPDSISGGSGQITLSAIKQDDSVDFRKTPALLINNTMSLIDSDAGEVEFQVKQVSVSEDLVSITGRTLDGRMNVNKIAKPIGGSYEYGDTLETAIRYYCELAGITPQFDAQLLPYVSSRFVNFIGWEGNLWEQLKLLCASTSASETEDIPMEMVVDVDTLKFRIANNRSANLTDNASSIAVEVDNFDASQRVSLTMYKTQYVANGIVVEDTDLDGELGFLQNVSIRDQMQVDAGQTIIKRFKMKASLETVNTPTPRATISSYPYTSNIGEYVIVGSDDLPILPAQWVAQGGSLEVSLTGNPNEIEIKITAPQASQLEQAGVAGAYSLAPYKIGVESAGGVEYPAFYITGTGVFFERFTQEFYTGAADEFTASLSDTAIDSPFITTRMELASRGIAAAQAIAGPSVKISIDNQKDIAMGSTIGSVIEHNRTKYRIDSASFSATGKSATGISVSPVPEFNAIWAGKTFADFSATMGTITDVGSISFNEFTIIPLNKDI
jgi:hypothetical protein